MSHYLIFKYRSTVLFGFQRPLFWHLDEETRALHRRHSIILIIRMSVSDQCLNSKNVCVSWGVSLVTVLTYRIDECEQPWSSDQKPGGAGPPSSRSSPLTNHPVCCAAGGITPPWMKHCTLDTMTFLKSSRNTKFSTHLKGILMMGRKTRLSTRISMGCYNGLNPKPSVTYLPSDCGT